MSREKIEEMRKEVAKAHRFFLEDDDYESLDDYIADELYNAGYRKQIVGEWGFDGMSWTCSECGEYAPIDKHRNTIKCKFCPNCGAHMKGANNED